MVEDAISNEFIKRHYTGLYTLLHRRIRDGNIAQEILNEAVATAIAHSRAGRVSDQNRLAGYVYRVALNLYRNYRREYANRPGVHAGDENIDQLPAQRATEESAMDSSIMRHVVSTIASLPTARDREIVKRFYLDEEDKSEICRSMGLSPLHFDRVVFRARQRMRSLLEAKGLDKSDFFIALLSCGMC
ncbi:RNA polymerase sigma factor [Steroidobacter agaridevorans]|uniref:RNA polymerase sigma factor n=1 Tax=Steroidobacter agaridevorans TaxID=2695856 RepID=UPI00137AE93E|nr:sigma-70 family RNA polymerase sigma factor [Steroidobacter agaridevorans]